MTEPAEPTDMPALAVRLRAASAAIEGLRADVAAGDPWPLSAAYGSEPESDWGPKEVLAHVAEMLDYWQAEIARILDGGQEPVPFGRVSTDPARIERIGRDRLQPTSELFDHLAAGAGRLAARMRTLAPSDLARRGLHPRLGEMTVDGILTRFLVSHLEEHVKQLREILDRTGTTGPRAAT
jgi:hypothetical protein